MDWDILNLMVFIGLEKFTVYILLLTGCCSWIQLMVTIFTSWKGCRGRSLGRIVMCVEPWILGIEDVTSYNKNEDLGIYIQLPI